MLALPRPYGSDAYAFAHLTLTVQGELDCTEAKHEMMQFGCPEVYADKAISCLVHSGRYDAYLQRGWVKQQYLNGNVVERFAGVGLDFHINEFHPPL